MSFDIKIKRRWESRFLKEEAITEQLIISKLDGLRKWCMVFQGKIFTSPDDIETIFITEKNYDLWTDWYGHSGYFFECTDEKGDPANPIDAYDVDPDFHPFWADVTQEYLSKYAFWIAEVHANDSVKVAFSTKKKCISVNETEATFKEGTDVCCVVEMANEKEIWEAVSFDIAIERIEGVGRFKMGFDKRIRNAVSHVNRMLAQKTGLTWYFWVRGKAFYRNY